MLFNRTIEDVNRAIDIRKSKIQAGLPLTDADVAILEKGMITTSTLNRIETKIGELYIDLKNLGYYCDPLIVKSDWSESEIFYENDFVRIIGNCQKLKLAFIQSPEMPTTLKAIYHYTALNDIERLLHLIETTKFEVLSNYKECGLAECGVI